MADDGAPAPPHGAPISKAERKATLEGVVAQLGELLSAGTIDAREHKKRLRAARDAFGGSCLWMCRSCSVVYGKGAHCPRCGKLVGSDLATPGLVTPGDPAWESTAAHVSNPHRWRRLSARLLADLLRIDGEARSAWLRRAAAAVPDLYDEALASVAAIYEELGLGPDGEQLEEESEPPAPPRPPPRRLKLVE